MRLLRLAPYGLMVALVVGLAAAPPAFAVSSSVKVSVLQQLEKMLGDVEGEAIDSHPDNKKQVRNVTIPLQGIVEDNILSANKQVLLNPQAILSAIEDELGKGSDKKAISGRLVRDFLAGRYFAK